LSCTKSIRQKFSLNSLRYRNKKQKAKKPKEREMFETEPLENFTGADLPMELPEPEPEVASIEDLSKKEKKTKSSVEKKSGGVLKTVRNFTIGLKDINLPDKYNRDKIGDIKGLVQSIKSVGQKVALVVRVDPSDTSKVILVDGRRRFTALQEAGIKEAFVTFTDDNTDADAFLTSMLTNLAREGHNPIEIAEGFQYAIDSGKKQKDISAACGKSDAFVSQHLAILKLPPEAIKYARTEKLKFAHLRSLLRVFTEEDLKFYDRVFQATIENDWTPEDTENAIVHYLDKKAEKAKAAGAKTDKKKAGRPTKKKDKLKDYANLSMKLVSPSKAKEIFVEAKGLYETANTKDRVNYYKGILVGMERLSGIRDTF
jgi:ParB/RepB/Spo0J family partition protein